MKGYRPPEIDEYGWARLCQVIGNTIGGTLSVGIGRYENQDKDMEIMEFMLLKIGTL